MIIISMLGLSGYETTYRLSSDLPEITTKHLPYAFTQWFPEAESVVLATKGAADSENGKDFQKQLPNTRRVPIPNGSNESEGWDIFEILSKTIPEGSDVILDMTHGFRTLPMLSFLCLSYLRIAKGVNLKAIYYGAFDAKDERGVAPIFDLTPFISLLDWAQAAKRFEDTGDASLFRPLLSVKRAASYNGVASQLEHLSQNIFGNRGLSIPQAANELLNRLEKAGEGQLETHQQPFALILEKLKTQIQPLAAPDGDDTLTLRAQYALICWYAERGHYPQAMSLAREWLISVRQWLQLGRISMNETEREGINNDLALANKLRQTKQEDYFYALPVHLQKMAEVADSVTKLRNDMMHFGFKENCVDASKFS